MTTSALIYRPPSQWPILSAFAAAIAIHLCAVALGTRRAPIPLAPIVCPGPDIIGIDEAEPMPPVSEFETPVPPPALFSADFIEETGIPPSKVKQNAGPIRKSATATRFAASSNSRALALAAPRPDYPYEARSRHITGSGVVTLRVDDASGTVLEASMEQSIGSPILDQSALSALRRWRFKRGTPPHVRVPITFTMMGAQF